MLNFFEQFRKIFIGDQVQKSSKVYLRMSELLGINDETMLLNVNTNPPHKGVFSVPRRDA